MRDGVCPKCGSNKIYVNGSEKSTFVSRDGDHMTRIKGGVLPNYATFDDYVCTDCGYAESYVLDQGKLEAIRAHWTLVSKNDAKRKNDDF